MLSPIVCIVIALILKLIDLIISKSRILSVLNLFEILIQFKGVTSPLSPGELNS